MRHSIIVHRFESLVNTEGRKTRPVAYVSRLRLRVLLIQKEEKHVNYDYLMYGGLRVLLIQKEEKRQT